MGNLRQWWPESLRTCFSPFAEAAQKRECLGTAMHAVAGWNPAALEQARLLLILHRTLGDDFRLVYGDTVDREAVAVARRTVFSAKKRRDVLTSVLTAADTAGIPVLLLRNPYLVERIYGGDYSLRPFRDLDLAVRPIDLGSFARMLKESLPGVRLRVQDPDTAARKLKWGCRLEIVVDGIAVDVHWNLTRLYNFSPPMQRSEALQGIWSRTLEREYTWGRCRVMSDADLLLHLAEHAVVQHDIDDRILLNVIEFASFYKECRESVRPERLLEVASERGRPLALMTACYAVSRLLFVPQDERTLLSLADPPSFLLRAQVARQLSAAARSLQEDPKDKERRQSRGVGRKTRGLATTAHLIPATRTRLSLARSLLLPTRQQVSYATDRSLSAAGYMRYLLVHPAVALLLSPVLIVLALRQMEDGARTVGGLVRRIGEQSLTGLFVGRYYASHLQHTGLVGRQAWSVWRERLTLGPWRRCSQNPIWLHVAGPGDALAAIRFMTAFAESEPESAAHFHLTCGSVAARAILLPFAEEKGIPVDWLPFDAPVLMNRFLERLRPRAFVGMQGEIWPAALKAARERRIPAVLLRMDLLDWDTQREYPCCVRRPYERLLGLVDLFSVRSHEHERRLQAAGVDRGRIAVGEDYRLEILAESNTVDGSATEVLLSRSNHPVVALTGLRPDELKRLLPGLLDVVADAGARILLAPVEPDDLRRLEQLFHSRGLPLRRFSEIGQEATDGAHILLDGIGHLRRLYAGTSVAVIGDTFGQAFSVGRNLWEALAQGTPVVYGPNLPRSSAVDMAESLGVALRAASEKEAAAHVRHVLEHPPCREQVKLKVAEIVGKAPRASVADVQAVRTLLRRRQDEPTQADVFRYPKDATLEPKEYEAITALFLPIRDS